MPDVYSSALLLLLRLLRRSATARKPRHGATLSISQFYRICIPRIHCCIMLSQPCLLSEEDSEITMQSWWVRRQDSRHQILQPLKCEMCRKTLTGHGLEGTEAGFNSESPVPGHLGLVLHVDGDRGHRSAAIQHAASLHGTGHDRKNHLHLQYCSLCCHIPLPGSALHIEIVSPQRVLPRPQ